jgi:hypothetical protein
MDVSGSRTESKEVIIRDVEGRPAYRLSVYAVSLNHHDVASISVELSGIGAAVAEHEVKYEPDLLNPDRMGHGAGQRKFTAEQLCPANRDRPYWGAARVFALRRMKIEVRISDIEMREGFEGIRKARVRVNVMPSSISRGRPADIAYHEPRPCM